MLQYLNGFTDERSFKSLFNAHDVKGVKRAECDAHVETFHLELDQLGQSKWC